MKKRIEIICIAILLIVLAVLCADGTIVPLHSPKGAQTFPRRVSAPPLLPEVATVAALPYTPTRNVTMGWMASPAPDVTGYTLSWGGVSGVYTNSVTVSGLLASIVGLNRGATYYIAARAYNATGESVPSNEIVYTVPVVDTYGVSATIVRGSPGAWISVVTLPTITVTNTGNPMTLLASKMDLWLLP